MKIHHISDTHGYHHLLSIPDDIDMIIHSGDFTNYYDVYKNEQEALNFLKWYGSLNVKYKILIAGNHDAYASQFNKLFRDWCKHYEITYLENEHVEIEGISIFGSPITPNFGNWYFQKDRVKLDRFWRMFKGRKIDILVSHGPPLGILDLAYKQDRIVEMCGDKSLLNFIYDIKPKWVLFGHIHANQIVNNQGVLTRKGINFSNAAVVKDNKFGNIYYHGTTFEL